MQSLFAAHLTLDQVITKVCEKKWEEEIISKFLRKFAVKNVTELGMNAQVVQNCLGESSGVDQEFEPANAATDGCMTDKLKVS